jgi:putative membrane protein
MNNDHIHHSSGFSLELFLALPFLLALVLYIVAAVVSSRTHKRWPLSRYFFWIIGVLCATATMVGPIASHSHTNFTVHMLGHLLLGMLAPLLIVFAAPMTLLLRTLNVHSARRLTLVMKSLPVSFFTNPIIAASLNFGGLWVLYTTDLYAAMQHNSLLHWLVHMHVFMAGYLFTLSMVYIDPAPHRYCFIYRTIVMVASLTSHGILSKYIYAYPPNGVPAAQAEIGGMLMYYGGDAIDLILIFVFCSQWYKATRPRTSLSLGQ